MNSFVRKFRGRKQVGKTIFLDPLKKMNQVCLPATRDVLLYQLRLQVRHMYPSLDEDDITELINDITKGKTNNDIIYIMEDPTNLQEAIQEGCQESIDLCSRCSIKDMLGEELFSRVAAYDTQLSAQITGMLLELEEETLDEILCDSSALKRALDKAREEFLLFHSKNTENKPHSENTEKTDTLREEMGERLFAVLVEAYPEEAAKITGMLLELDLDDLQKIIESKDALFAKVQVALKALQQEEVVKNYGNCLEDEESSKETS